MWKVDSKQEQYIFYYYNSKLNINLIQIIKILTWFQLSYSILLVKRKFVYLILPKKNAILH